MGTRRSLATSSQSHELCRFVLRAFGSLWHSSVGIWQAAFACFWEFVIRYGLAFGGLHVAYDIYIDGHFCESKKVRIFFYSTQLDSRSCPAAPDTDIVVGVPSEQGVSVRRPSQRHTLGSSGLLWVLLGAVADPLGGELVNLALLLEVEDDDVRSGGSAQPVTVGREYEGVDLVTGVERVQVLGLIQVPQHGGPVLSSGSAKRSIRRDGDGVDVTGVTAVVGLDTAGRELPNLWNDLRQYKLPAGFIPAQNKKRSLGRVCHQRKKAIDCLMALKALK